MTSVRRHALFTVVPATWTMLAGEHPEQEVRAWASKGRPLIRRRSLSPENDLIALGLPLPPSMGKLRLPFLVPSQSAQPFPRPSTLAAHRACRGLSVAHKADIASLLSLAERHGLKPHVTGSLLWQSLTGLQYLSETSDLDLLWYVDPARDDVETLLHDLADTARTLSLPLDGEIIFPGDRAVQWRELLNTLKCGDDSPLLVKSLTGVTLLSPSALFSSYAESLPA